MNLIDTNEYTMRIHFPNTSITLEKIKGDTASIWWGWLKGTVEPVEITYTKRTYLVNPNMITYIEVNEYLPF